MPERLNKSVCVCVCVYEREIKERERLLCVRYGNVYVLWKQTNMGEGEMTEGKYTLEDTP